ncbi:MAG TPA: response regulator [Rhizomicrobium sp.]|nr:response regulator [Rhizomicrobium sp.]
MRVLIVEDEIVVALFLEDLLAEFGYEVAGVVSRVEEAMAHPPDYDVAVLDVHLNGRNVFDFADRLAAAGTPFVFATGYGSRGIPDRHCARPVLQKPFRPEELKKALAMTQDERKMGAA